MKNKLFLGAVAAVAAFTALTITGCGQGAVSGTSAAGANSAAMVVTAGDAPLANILAAKVTISSITIAPSGGGNVTVLSSPRTLELSSLGAIQEPVSTENVPAGTYSAANIMVSSATVTYVDSTGKIVTGTTTVNSPPVTTTLSPALTVTQGQDVHLTLDFNLAKSFDLSGSTLTFTPSITSAAAAIEGESEADRDVEVTGSVVSVDSSSITVKSADTGVQSKFTINPATQFSTGLSTGSIVAGEIVTVHGTIQTGGSFLATRISASTEADSMENPQGGIGIVTAVKTDGSGNVTSFTFVPRQDFEDTPSSGSVTVALSSSTTYGVDDQAVADGISATAFNNAEIFPGQSVQVLGTFSGGSIAAQEVDLAPESLSGTLFTAPEGASPGYSFKLLLATQSFLTTYGLPNPLSASTNAQTQYKDKLTAAAFASLAAGAALEVHGYLLQGSSGNYSLTVSDIAQGETETETETK